MRLLRWFARSGLIAPDDVREMPGWENSGFSLDATVRVGAHDRAGPERLLRYCARPPFALERLELLEDERVVYRLPKPQRDGTTALTLTPLELIDHLAALIPPPRRHRHRYHGVLAPNAPLRAAAIAFGREVADATGAPAEVSSSPRAPASHARSPARTLWAVLLARLFESLPLVCPNCGADMRIIAFITDAASVELILTHIGEPSRQPRITPARGPPAWADGPEPMPDWDLLKQPEPDCSSLESWCCVLNHEYGGVFGEQRRGGLGAKGQSPPPRGEIGRRRLTNPPSLPAASPAIRVRSFAEFAIALRPCGCRFRCAIGSAPAITPNGLTACTDSTPCRTGSVLIRLSVARLLRR